MVIENVGHSSNIKAVRATLDSVYVAWAKNDADEFVARYVKDATAVLPGIYLPDREALREAMAGLFAGPFKGSRAVHEVRKIRFPHSGTAVLISEGAVILAGQTQPDETSRSIETWVMGTHQGRWLIEAFHNCPLNAAWAADVRSVLGVVD